MTRRLVISYLAVTVVVLVLLEIPFAVFYSRREIDRLTAEIERDASVLATLFEDDLEGGLSPDPVPARRYAASTGARVLVVDERGVSVVDTSQPIPRDLSTRPEIALALSGRHTTGSRHSKSLGTDIIYVAVPVASGGRVHGALRLNYETTAVKNRINRFRLGLGAIAVIALAAVALVSRSVAQSVTRPLTRIGESARRFADGDLSVDTSSVSGPAEIRELADIMAIMATRLDTMIQQQRAFVSDASHQLRTPLTAMRLRLDNLAANLADPDDLQQVEFAIEEIDRLSVLVNNLLRLARSEDRPPTVPQDLTLVASERCQIWQAAAENSGVRLLFKPSDSHLFALGQTGAIEQILDNLLDNAICAAPSGTVVTVGLVGGRDHHELTVVDNGSGLDDEGKDRALRRFWRGDSTRPGTGLGLPIAEQLARGSGGSLTLHDNPDGGLLVRVTLVPASEEPT